MKRHMAGASVTISNRFVRQRCAWCGLALIDLDLETVPVEIQGGKAVKRYPQFPPGSWVTLANGEARQLLPEPGTPAAAIPEQACCEDVAKPLIIIPRGPESY